MDYFSFFSGIGGFELGIKGAHPGSNCLGYSEVESSALKVYKKHFPEHHNMGDIFTLTEKDIIDRLNHRKFDTPILVVGGFPCTNLSSIGRIRGDSRGLKGKESSLFYSLIRVMKIIQKHTAIHFLLENNASMSKKNKELITKTIEKEIGDVFLVMLDASSIVVQKRRRLFWSSFHIPELNEENEVIQTWDDVLDPMDEVGHLAINTIEWVNNTVKGLKGNGILIRATRQLGNGMYKFIPVSGDGKTRWQLSNISDTGDENSPNIHHTYPVGKSRVVLTAGAGTKFIDRRFGDDQQFMFRLYSINETEKLFTFPENWVDSVNMSNTNKRKVLGKSIVVEVVTYALFNLK